MLINIDDTFIEELKIYIKNKSNKVLTSKIICAKINKMVKEHLYDLQALEEITKNDNVEDDDNFGRHDDNYRFNIESVK